ncbi:MAG: hypothetical protein M5U28_03160 [Sandaracinaceae bacterium]|nr:hypothetical protein [Sandaracinaceae bacterium]
MPREIRVPRVRVQAHGRAREDEQDGGVAIGLRAHVRAQHLHGHLGAVGEEGAVHLRHARGGDRLVLEALEELLHLRAEVGLDLRARLTAGEGWQAILEEAQLVDELRLEEVRPRAHHLAELDEGGAEAGQRPAKEAARGARERAPVGLVVVLEGRAHARERVADERDGGDERDREGARQIAERAHGAEHSRSRGPVTRLGYGPAQTSRAAS